MKTLAVALQKNGKLLSASFETVEAAKSLGGELLTVVLAESAESMAQELASRGVTVNAVAPGFIRTDMTAALTADVQQALLAGIPLGVLGEPEDVAAAVLFLLGPGGRYITGQVIAVNGGMAM